MAFFTFNEATASTISRCTAKFSDTGKTQHMYYVFGVTDADGIGYDWKDFSLPAGSDKPTIKSAIHLRLISGTTKSYISSESSDSDESIIGESPQ